MSIKFSDVTVPRPSEESLAANFATVDALLDQGERAEAIAVADVKMREYQTWMSLAGLRFAQNTTDPAAKADREYADALGPKVAEYDVVLKRRLLADFDRTGLEKITGAHAVRLWEMGVTTFDPVISADLEEASALTARYAELTAGAKVTVQGQIVNLSGIAPFAESLDRDIRHESQKARWDFFADHGAEFDKIYDDLVRLRHGMAQKLGYKTFTPLGYRLMGRVDYSDSDVARYREQVKRDIVPLVARQLEQRRKDAGWEKLYVWDENLTDLKGNAKPAGDHDVLVERAKTLFENIHPRLAAFYKVMVDGGFTDLKNRDGKAGGGFCTWFPSHGVPFIFANFTGTYHDIDVFTHEMGHAFQNWESRHQPLGDYLMPTAESAEILSMSLEFLAQPHIDLMIEDGAADRYRHMHLTNALGVLPPTMCGDHFQHDVYANPTATPAERHEMWLRHEKYYLPWRDNGDLAYPAKGARWQAIPHFFNSPFYYIDYALAQCCALQYWAWSRKDYKAAIESYVTLCARGGSAPFQDLVRGAGLVSPFDADALTDAAHAAEAVLAL